jgi:hypothetical protein
MRARQNAADTLEQGGILPHSGMDGLIQGDMTLVYNTWINGVQRVVVGLQVTNGCNFDFVGGYSNQYCGQQLRKIIDGCNTNDVKYKAGMSSSLRSLFLPALLTTVSPHLGGKLTDNCAVWTIYIQENVGKNTGWQRHNHASYPFYDCDTWTGSNCDWCL